MEDTSDNDNRQNPRKHFTAIRQFKSGLPSIPGIFALSKAEIKKDVREMERSMHSDTDSDSSVLSEDVLPSTYPVKPRKTPKGTVTQKPPAGAVAEIDPLEREYDSKMIEQTLVFLDSLKRNKKDLYNAEVERERLENQSMSFRTSIEDVSKRFRQEKRDQGNYFKILQGFHSQALRMRMGYNRKNTMYTDILLALQRRKEASDIMATEVSSLRLLLHNPVVSKKVVGKSSNSSVDNVNDNGFTNINTLDTNSVETSFLRVELKSGKEIILYKGAWIRTPVGEGQIAQIIPIEDKLVVNLSFGKLYASIRRAVCWGFSNRMDLQLLDVSSDDSIRQRWLGLQSSFNMPTDATRVIHSLLGTQNDEDASTDKDDDNSNSNDDIVPTEETVGVALSSPVPGGLLMKTTSIDGEHLEKGKGANNSFVDPRTARALKAFPLVGNLATRKSTFSGPSQVNTEIGVSSSSAGSGSSSSSSSSKIVTLNTTIPSRKSLQKMLCATGSLSYVDCQPHCERELTSTLPLIFAPPAALPYLVERAEALEVPEVRYCHQALETSPNEESIGELAWVGDIMEMAKELVTLQDEVTRLENEQSYYISNVQKSRSDCAKLSTDTAALRLSMYTRRIVHRNAVNSHINNLRPPCGLSGTDLESATSSNGTTTYEIVGSVDIGAAHAVKSPNGHAVSVATIPVTRVTRNAAAAIKEEPTTVVSRSSRVTAISTAPSSSSTTSSVDGNGSSNSNGASEISPKDTSDPSTTVGSRKRSRDVLPVVPEITSVNGRRSRSAAAPSSGTDAEPPKEKEGRRGANRLSNAVVAAVTSASSSSSLNTASADGEEEEEEEVVSETQTVGEGEDNYGGDEDGIGIGSVLAGGGKGGKGQGIAGGLNNGLAVKKKAKRPRRF